MCDFFFSVVEYHIITNFLRNTCGGLSLWDVTVCLWVNSWSSADPEDEGIMVHGNGENTHLPAQCHIPEDFNFQYHNCENLKSYTSIFMLTYSDSLNWHVIWNPIGFTCESFWHVRGCIKKFPDWTYRLECMYLI